MLTKVKFVTNIINNSLKTCFQIMKIPKNEYLKSLSPIYNKIPVKITNGQFKNLVKIKYVI